MLCRVFDCQIQTMAGQGKIAVRCECYSKHGSKLRKEQEFMKNLKMLNNNVKHTCEVTFSSQRSDEVKFLISSIYKLLMLILYFCDLCEIS